MTEHDDRETVRELEELLRQVRDKAHWLSVVRRHRLASHIERAADGAFLMAVDLRGMVARGESPRR